jgi:hypothetical protein
VDAHESFGLAHTATLGYMLQDRDHFLRGQLRSEEGGALAFGKPILTDIAVKEAVLLLFTVAIADREISLSPEAVFGAGGILAAEPG